MAILFYSLIFAALAIASPHDGRSNGGSNGGSNSGSNSGSNHGGSPPDPHAFIAATPTDLRAPCPGLNTLANHGYLPRNGRNITVPMIIQASLDGFNAGVDAIQPFAKFGLLSSAAPDTLNLNELVEHGLIEHDASLSRLDAALGDSLHFNEGQFSTLANSNPGVNYYNTTSAGHVQRDLLAQSIRLNVNQTNTPKEFKIRTRESAFYLSVLGDPLTGIAPKNFVQIFFREERLPIAEGWKKPNTLITAATLGALQTLIVAAADWTATQACETEILGPALTL
ncbi:putative Cloroperoxidase [Mycena venus]|uniref:Putative Cloroperoxidase n=1 Tax=Mycena venus TaxID=2733690 RepID=A0A8H6YGK4_9AGAR|nr:putative Cloroperoxidase [Mycena venus]